MKAACPKLLSVFCWHSLLGYHEHTLFHSNLQAPCVLGCVTDCLPPGSARASSTLHHSSCCQSSCSGEAQDSELQEVLERSELEAALAESRRLVARPRQATPSPAAQPDDALEAAIAESLAESRAGHRRPASYTAVIEGTGASSSVVEGQPADTFANFRQRQAGTLQNRFLPLQLATYSRQCCCRHCHLLTQQQSKADWHVCLAQVLTSKAAFILSPSRLHIAAAAAASLLPTHSEPHACCRRALGQDAATGRGCSSKCAPRRYRGYSFSAACICTAVFHLDVPHEPSQICPTMAHHPPVAP